MDQERLALIVQLRDEGLRLQAIGDRLNPPVTRERVRQILMQWTGASTIPVDPKLRILEKFDEDHDWAPATRKVAAFAREAGYTAAPVLKINGVCSGLITVNDIKCFVISRDALTFLPRHSAQHPGYYRFNHTSMHGAKFVLALCGNENLFVLPQSIVGQKSFYIRAAPAVAPAYHGIRPRIDFWPYLDAWHLIDGKSL